MDGRDGFGRSTTTASEQAGRQAGKQVVLAHPEFSFFFSFLKELYF
jgi:hypothetical protein